MGNDESSMLAVCAEKDDSRYKQKMRELLEGGVDPNRAPHGSVSHVLVPLHCDCRISADATLMLSVLHGLGVSELAVREGRRGHGLAALA
jgi:hypothetical protein